MRLYRPRWIDVMGIKHVIRYLKIEKDGFYCPDDKIEISNDITEEEHFLKVLIHEGLHGVVEKTGLHQDINDIQEHVFIDSTITFLFRNFDIRLKRKRRKK